MYLQQRSYCRHKCQMFTIWPLAEIPGLYHLHVLWLSICLFKSIILLLFLICSIYYLSIFLFSCFLLYWQFLQFNCIALIGLLVVISFVCMRLSWSLLFILNWSNLPSDNIYTTYCIISCILEGTYDCLLPFPNPCPLCFCSDTFYFFMSYKP